MTQHSKLLSYVLRHRPEEAGLTLDAGGWVQVDDLVAGLNAAGHRVDRETVLRIAAEGDKKRFTVSDDERRIRAAQGHSVEVDLGLTPAEPPAVLYHGTAEGNLAPILTEGLKPGRRQKVHLSGDVPIAVKVGQRHGRPVVLRVDAMAMHRDGLVFWQADNGVWLADLVPPHYLAAL